MDDRTGTLSLDQVGGAILRERRSLLAVVLACLAAGGLTGWLWPDRFEATATLTVEPVAVIDPGSAASVNMETERVVATSTEVLGPAAVELGTSAENLANGLTVTVPRGSQVLEFAFEASSPAFAAEAANAVAESYRAQRVSNAEEIVRQATENLSGRIQELVARLATADPAGAEARSLDVQIQTLQERLAVVVSNTFYPGSLVSPATTPTDSTKPSLAVFLAGGAVLGLFVGCFAALVLARMHARRDPAAAPVEVPVAVAPQPAAPEPAPAPAPAPAAVDRPPRPPRKRAPKRPAVPVE